MNSKKRKYRWNDGSDGRPRSWHIEIDEDSLDAEIKFLRQEIYRRDVELLVQSITSAARTIPTSHSGRQASSRRPCCHKESAVASRLPNLAEVELTGRHRRRLCVSGTSLSAPPIEVRLNQPACRRSFDRACGACCLGSSQSTPTWQLN